MSLHSRLVLTPKLLSESPNFYDSWHIRTFNNQSAISELLSHSFRISSEAFSFSASLSIGILNDPKSPPLRPTISAGQGLNTFFSGDSIGLLLNQPERISEIMKRCSSPLVSNTACGKLLKLRQLIVQLQYYKALSGKQNNNYIHTSPVPCVPIIPPHQYQVTFMKHCKVPEHQKNI